jgi:hypothetical protein
MAAAGRGHLHEEELSETAREAAEGPQEFLRNAHYRPQGDYEICDDTGLRGRLSPFFDAFAKPLIEVWCVKFLLATWLTYENQSGFEVRITALRFRQRANLPVTPGVIELIPVIISGNPSISNKVVRLGWSLRLTEDVTVESELYCLAVLLLPTQPPDS